ncbi:MAG: YeiH family protein [Proteobacteria bacterium]|nr:YeiH family protein [Pseudomonadota bacterium]
MAQGNDDIVRDVGKWEWSELWKKEDWWAIWLGFAILIIGLLIYVPRGPVSMESKIASANKILKAESEKAPFRTIAWFKASDAKGKLKATSSGAGKTIKKFTGKPHGWSSNPLDAFFMSDSKASAKAQKAVDKFEAAKEREASLLAAAMAAENAASGESFKNNALNQKAIKAIGDWRFAINKTSSAKKKANVKGYNQIFYLIALMVITGVFFSIGRLVMGENISKFLIGFVGVFLVAVLAYTLTAQSGIKSIGFGYPLWAIAIGMLISNTIGTPKWIEPAVQTEYYIKTGLVLLGAEILFGKILSIGVPGIFVAWIVTPIVLTTTYFFGQKIVKMPSKTLNVTISSDMSVCGVSAAIATAAACRAKKEELTLAVGLSMVFTSIMMIAMPAFITATGMHHVLGGAWMGGTIDATGAVAAAGAFLSDTAMYVAATIKMIQNVLIGLVAFVVALIWTTKIDKQAGQDVGMIEIWFRFPKFVLGFIAASIFFSLLYGSFGKDAGYTLLEHGAIRGGSRIFRGWFFCLAFSSIGLATNFRELKSYFKGGKPLILYVCGQSFNLMLTLLMAYIMFFLVFPEITAQI